MLFVLEVVRHTKCAKVSKEARPGVFMALRARLADTTASFCTHNKRRI